MLKGKIWIATVGMDGKEKEHEWDSIEELQKDWCSEVRPCPGGDDEVLGYSLNGLIQDNCRIRENEHGYRDFSSLLKVLGVKDAKQVELLKMKSALECLHKAFVECEETFESNKFDCNDYILGSKESEDTYPFPKAFEEMVCLVSNWVYGCSTRVNKELENDR